MFPNKQLQTHLLPAIYKLEQNVLLLQKKMCCSQLTLEEQRDADC